MNHEEHLRDPIEEGDDSDADAFAVLSLMLIALFTVVYYLSS